MIHRDLGPDEVEAIAKHQVRPDELRLGYAAQHAAEELVEYKLARMLAMSLAEPVEIELEWVCTGRAIGKKGGLLAVTSSTAEVKSLPPAPPSCAVCGVRATDVADVEVPGYDGFVKHEPRCHVHA